MIGERLFIAENNRDDTMIDLYTQQDSGAIYMWGTIHSEFLSSVKIEVKEHFEANDNGLEIVIISREFYDMLMTDRKMQ